MFFLKIRMVRLKLRMFYLDYRIFCSNIRILYSQVRYQTVKIGYFIEMFAIQVSVQLKYLGRLVLKWRDQFTNSVFQVHLIELRDKINSTDQAWYDAFTEEMRILLSIEDEPQDKNNVKEVKLW